MTQFRVLSASFLLFAWVAFSNPAHAKSEISRQTPAGVSVPLSAYAEFRRTLEGRDGKPRPKNLQELIPRLSPSLRSSFTLIYESRSPHSHPERPELNAVDTLHPRVLLFTPDARLMLAFTGHPEKPGYNIIEAIDFKDSTASFSLSRFVLPDAAAQNPSLSALAKKNGKLNPTECLRCHGVDPRPIFDSYDVWPGFYGSLADEPGLLPQELSAFRSFLQTQRSKTPYKELTWPKVPTSSVYPYRDSDGKAPAPLESAEQLTLLPNTRLGMALTELNRARIFRKLKESDDYERLKFVLIQGLAGCKPLPLTEEFRNRVHQAVVLENESKFRRARIIPGTSLAEELEMQELRPELKLNLPEIEYLAGALHIPRSDWSLAFEPGSISFFDGILSGIVNGASYYLKEDILLGMLTDLTHSHPEFQPYLGTYNSYQSAGLPFGTRLDLLLIHGNASFCRLLEQKIISERSLAPPLAQISWLPPALSAAPGNPFRKCVHCHTQEGALSGGMIIPFGDPQTLQRSLGRPASSKLPLFSEILKRIRPEAKNPMPMNAPPLSLAERRDIETWIKTRAGRDNSFPGTPPDPRVRSRTSRLQAFSR